MSRAPVLLRIALALAVAAVLAYIGERFYRRSLPPPPVVVQHGADLSVVLAGSPLEGARRALLGRRTAVGPKLIALTFDDGPYPVGTPYLLAALRELHVRATFFLIGRDAEQYPGLVREIAAAGEEVGDHTETHPNLDQLDDAAVTAELLDGAQTLERYDKDPAIRRFFRPPHGRYTNATLRDAQRAGFDTILWTDDPGDWRAVGPQTLLTHVLGYATSPEIVLLHNGRPATVQMLPEMVASFRRAGYTFVTVGELLRRTTPEQLERAGWTPIRADGEPAPAPNGSSE